MLDDSFALLKEGAETQFYVGDDPVSAQSNENIRGSNAVCAFSLYAAFDYASKALTPIEGALNQNPAAECLQGIPDQLDIAFEHMRDLICFAMASCEVNESLLAACIAEQCVRLLSLANVVTAAAEEDSDPNYDCLSNNMFELADHWETCMSVILSYKYPNQSDFEQGLGVLKDGIKTDYMQQVQLDAGAKRMIDRAPRAWGLDL